MSIFDSHLELEILMDDIVQGFIDKGKSYDWIQDTISETISYAIQDHKDENGVVDGT